MNEDTRRKIIAEIDKARQAEGLQPDEITHRMYADETGESINVSERILQEEVTAGRMTCRIARVGGKNAWAYKLV